MSKLGYQRRTLSTRTPFVLFRHVLVNCSLYQLRFKGFLAIVVLDWLVAFPSGVVVLAETHPFGFPLNGVLAPAEVAGDVLRAVAGIFLS